MSNEPEFSGIRVAAEIKPPFWKTEIVLIGVDMMPDLHIVANADEIGFAHHAVLRGKTESIGIEAEVPDIAPEITCQLDTFARFVQNTFKRYYQKNTRGRQIGSLLKHDELDLIAKLMGNKEKVTRPQTVEDVHALLLTEYNVRLSWRTLRKYLAHLATQGTLIQRKQGKYLYFGTPEMFTVKAEP